MHTAKPKSSAALRMTQRWLTANCFFIHVGLVLDFMASSSVHFVEIVVAQEGERKVAGQRELLRSGWLSQAGGIMLSHGVDFKGVANLRANCCEPCKQVRIDCASRLPLDGIAFVVAMMSKVRTRRIA